MISTDAGLTLGALTATAAGLGFTHTLLGPDHYVPFVAMARAGGWSPTKTALITLLCGIAHVLSSVVLGAVGIAAGIAVFKLQTIEGLRGDLAGWLLLAFGLAYSVWGLRHAIRHQPHTHVHLHQDGTTHRHQHVHVADHAHVHTPARGGVTPWILFLIFVFGPCEPLIPLVMYPAAQGSLWGVALVTFVFGAATLATMLTLVLLGHLGTMRVAPGRLARFGHALAGSILAACGAAILLGL